MRKIIDTFGKYLVVALIMIAMFLFYTSVERKPLLAKDNTKFVKAVVIQNDNEDLQAAADLESGDSQEVVLRIKSGSHKGEEVKAYSLNGYLYGANCKVVVMMYIPMMYIGVSPFIAATLSVVIITLITFILLADFQKKSIGAMLGTIAGVVVSGLIALVFGHFGHVTGYNVDDIENLIYVGQNSKLDIGGMLFSGILIASLGAVMDVAMSVSSSLHEIKENRPDISAKEIFRSGINIGRDMIGTMSNTLILAYAGGSLGLVMIIYAYSYQMHQILNMYSVAIEIMRGISGTMGIILTVPITSLIMSVLLTDKHKEK